MLPTATAMFHVVIIISMTILSAYLTILLALDLYQTLYRTYIAAQKARFEMRQEFQDFKNEVAERKSKVS